MAIQPRVVVELHLSITSSGLLTLMVDHGTFAPRHICARLRLDRGRRAVPLAPASSQVTLDIVQLLAQPFKDRIRCRIVTALHIDGWLHDLEAASWSNQLLNIGDQIISLIQQRSLHLGPWLSRHLRLAAADGRRVIMSGDILIEHVSDGIDALKIIPNLVLHITPLCRRILDWFHGQRNRHLCLHLGRHV
jgi:hypothetical protein